MIIIDLYIYTKRVMHSIIAHHPLTDAQPASKQELPPSQFPTVYQGLGLFFFFPLVVKWYGISLWPGQVSCPASMPSQLLVPIPSPLLEGQHKKLKN